MAISRNVSILWCGKVMIGGPMWTVPKLVFDKKWLILEVQQLIISYLQ